MRAVALALLALAAVVYVLTLERGGGWGYLHAASEAAMVGAIADWFAVTALFRHPLGLPIPHTALIPSRKATLARSLQEFVTDNFLSGPVVRDKVRGRGGFGEKVRLPDEPAGTMMVFRTFDRMSYGLIMEATNAISVLDTVRNP